MAKNVLVFFAIFRPVTTIITLQKYFYLVEEVLNFDLVGHMWKLIKNLFQKCIFCGKFCTKTLSNYFYLVEEILSFDLVGHMWKSVNNWLQKCIFSLSTWLRMIYCLQTIHESACVILTLFQFLPNSLICILCIYLIFSKSSDMSFCRLCAWGTWPLGTTSAHVSTWPTPNYF